MARKFKMSRWMVLQALEQECEKARGPVLMGAVKKNLEREWGYRAHTMTIWRILTSSSKVKVTPDKREGEPSLYRIIV